MSFLSQFVSKIDMAGKDVQSVKWLPHKHEDMGLDPQNSCKKLGW